MVVSRHKINYHERGYTRAVVEVLNLLKLGCVCKIHTEPTYEPVFDEKTLEIEDPFENTLLSRFLSKAGKETMMKVAGIAAKAPEQGDVRGITRIADILPSGIRALALTKIQTQLETWRANSRDNRI